MPPSLPSSTVLLAMSSIIDRLVLEYYVGISTKATCLCDFRAFLSLDRTSPNNNGLESYQTSTWIHPKDTKVGGGVLGMAMAGHNWANYFRLSTKGSPGQRLKLYHSIKPETRFQNKKKTTIVHIIPQWYAPLLFFHSSSTSSCPPKANSCVPASKVQLRYPGESNDPSSTPRTTHSSACFQA